MMCNSPSSKSTMEKDDLFEESLHSNATRKINNSSSRDLGYHDDNGSEENAPATIIPSSVDLGYGDDDETITPKVNAAPIKPDKRGSKMGRNAFSIYGDIDDLANEMKAEALAWSDSDSEYSESEFEEDMEDEDEEDEGYLSGEDPADFLRNLIKIPPPSNASATPTVSRDCGNSLQANQSASVVDASSERRLESSSDDKAFSLPKRSSARTGERPGSLRHATTVDQKPAARRLTMDNNASTCEEKRNSIRRMISADRTTNDGKQAPRSSAVKRVSRRNTGSNGSGTARKGSLSPIPPPMKRTSSSGVTSHGRGSDTSSPRSSPTMVRSSPARRTTMDHCRDRSTGDSGAPAPPRPSLTRSTMVVAGPSDSKTGRRLTMDLNAPATTKQCGMMLRRVTLDHTAAPAGGRPGTINSRTAPPPRRGRRSHGSVQRLSDYSGRAA